MNEFYKQFLNQWTAIDNYVFSRNEIMEWLQLGVINKEEADYLSGLRYDDNNGRIHICSEKEPPNDYVEGLCRYRKYGTPL